MHRIGTVANILRYVTAPDGGHHLICQGEQRFRVDRVRARSSPFSPRACTASPSQTCARPTSRRASAVSSGQAIGGARAAAAGAAGADRRHRERADRPRRWPTLPPPTWTSTPEREAGHPGDRRPDGADGQGLAPARRSASRCCGCRRRSAGRPRPSFDERQREAVLREQMAAIQSQLGEGDGKAQEIAELNEAIAKARHAQGGRGSRPARSCAGCERMPEAVGRIRHDPHLSRLADRAALGAAGGEADRHRRGAPHPRRRPFRPREDQAAHPRISGRAQARARRARRRSCASSARPASARPRSASPSPAPCGRKFVARQPRRRARRGRDPRPPPHLHRRAARQHHPGASARPARATA